MIKDKIAEICCWNHQQSDSPKYYFGQEINKRMPPEADDVAAVYIDYQRTPSKEDHRKQHGQVVRQIMQVNQVVPVAEKVIKDAAVMFGIHQQFFKH
jgi:hypothetical protein